MTNRSLLHFPAFSVAQEPPLAFHPDRAEDREVHPLRGLIRFGPYSSSLVNSVLDPIRVAVIAPAGWSRRADQFFGELGVAHSPSERRQYLPEFPGFQRLFGLRVVSDGSTGRVELPRETDGLVMQAAAPHLVLAEQLGRAVSQLAAIRSSFDVLAILLPKRWEAAFEGRDEEDFDLHDYLKALTANRGIPTQILREDKALSYRCRCSVMWRIAIALYTKAGGVPWKIANSEREVAFVGISYALRDKSEGPRFVTCCSQVFDADGSGLQFLLYNVDPAWESGDNPFLSRAEMRRLMARSLRLYQQRHSGRSPKRVVIHKATRFTPGEVDGCFDAWDSADGLDLVQVQGDSPWRGIKIESHQQAAKYPVDRGTYVGLDGRRALLWTQGTATKAVSEQDYYKEGKGIPEPLVLQRWAGHGAWESTCSSILGLTKMNWNNDGLYDRLPVTLSYASTLAQCAKRMPRISANPYELRYFM